LQKVLEEMKGKENRDASFVATIVICQPDGQTRTFEGQVFGFIGFEKKGERGFGYDPIFYPVNHSITFAEMDETSKNRISHRGIALSKFKEALNEIIDNQ
ncbi:MAG: non-canonical purine NTP pyrophosphatase, partial [Acholeplasmataceae bacterium]|nr:non-canonical purine NTP pyrophosphatase [Acholeplasmataceae bacterium]